MTMKSRVLAKWIGCLLLVQPTLLASETPLFKVEDGGKWGFIDQTGQMVIQPQYDGCYYSFSEGMGAVEIGGKWGYIDRKNQMVISPQFAGAQRFKNGVAAVRSNDSGWQYIDQEGRQLFTTDQQLSYFGFDEGLIEVSKGDKWGYMDAQGKMVIPHQFKETGSFSNGLAGVVLDEKTAGYINCKGEWVIRLKGGEPHYYGFSEGMAPVFDHATGKFGYIDRTGKFVIPPQFSDARDFQEGRAAVMITIEDSTGWPTRRWGVINKQGKFVAPAKYYTVWSYEEGMAKVVDMDMKDGFLDLNGKEVIPCQFTTVDPFENGLAYVRVGGHGTGFGWSGYINKKGEFVWRPSDYKKIDQANREKQLAEQKKRENPSIKVVVGNKRDENALVINCPSKLYLKGKDAGKITFTILNHLQQDVFLEVTAMSEVGYSVDTICGGSAGGGGTIISFPNSSRYQLIHHITHDADHICGCRFTYVHSKLPEDAMDLGRARGTISVWIRGYYRNNGEHFFESVEFPVEFVDGEQP